MRAFNCQSPLAIQDEKSFHLSDKFFPFRFLLVSGSYFFKANDQTMGYDSFNAFFIATSVPKCPANSSHPFAVWNLQNKFNVQDVSRKLMIKFNIAGVKKELCCALMHSVFARKRSFVFAFKGVRT